MGEGQLGGIWLIEDEDVMISKDQTLVSSRPRKGHIWGGGYIPDRFLTASQRPPEIPTRNLSLFGVLVCNVEVLKSRAGIVFCTTDH